MPQMAPMWWMSLMIMFIITMMMVMMMIFFIKKINLNKEIKSTIPQLNWKW